MKEDLKFNMKIRKKCDRCYRPESFCICEHIKTFKPRSKIVILIHPMEYKKQRLGTGRLTIASIEGSELIMGIDFTHDKRVNELISDEKYFPLVLYPGLDAIDITHPKEEEIKSLKNKIPLIFVIDGTWPCAKKMMAQSKNIQALPRISFSTEKTSEFLIKHQPHEKALSTVESVHVLLKDMARAGIESLDGSEDAMITAFKAMVARQIDCEMDPNLPSHHGKKRTKERSKLIRAKKNRSFILN